MVDRDLGHLFPRFSELVRGILLDLEPYAAKHMAGYEGWRVVEGLRSAAYQHSLWEQGRTKAGAIVTRCDGFATPSNHQSGLAVDIVPFKKGQPDWDAAKVHWEYLGHLARERKLHWGGDWDGFVDLPHVEWDPHDHEVYAEAKKWLRGRGLL